jgi:hypothetical protein
MPRQEASTHRLGALRPATVIGVFYLAIVLALLATHAWDPLFFATLGPQWQRHDPALRKHGDGAIYYRFATDPAGSIESYTRLRIARILYPLAARALALGRAELVGWTLLLINLVAIVAGTEILHRLLARRGLPPWAALAYGAWVGLGLALLHDTPEPLTYLCALAGIAAWERNRAALATAFFIGALLTRETALALILPYLLFGRQDRGMARWGVPLAVLGGCGTWLGLVYVMGTGAWVPGRLLLRIPMSGYLWTRPFDLPATLLFMVIPALLVVGWTAHGLWRRPVDASLWAAALNALFVLWLPPRAAELLWHSGRLSSGLIAAVLLSVPLATSAPRLWRGLTVLFAGSAAWTMAVTVRYLLWEVAPW